MIAAALIGVLIGAAPPDSLVVATWNIEWLAAVDGKGPVHRSKADYARLARYARALNADVVALQEVAGPKAAARVFDPKEYRFHFAGRGRQRVGFAWRRHLNVVVQPDLHALGRKHLRPGADIEVRTGGLRLRLLAIHLKSGCHKQSLKSPRSACRKLARQVPVLESWIDARARDNTPFLVLGDFNRRLGDDDAMWIELDDGDPAAADLTLVSTARPACWNRRYSKLIDHIVVGRNAARWVQPDSFRELVYDPADAAFEATLSDHCPVSVRLAVQ